MWYWDSNRHLREGEERDLLWFVIVSGEVEAADGDMTSLEEKEDQGGVSSRIAGDESGLRKPFLHTGSWYKMGSRQSSLLDNKISASSTAFMRDSSISVLFCTLVVALGPIQFGFTVSWFEIYRIDDFFIPIVVYLCMFVCVNCWLFEFSRVDILPRRRMIWWGI